MIKSIPRFSDLILPTFTVLRKLGGSGTNQEIHKEVVELLRLPSKIVEISHLGSTSMSELMYRLAWARTYMKKAGVITNSSRAVWSIMPDYNDKAIIDAGEIVQFVRKNSTTSKSITNITATNEEDESELLVVSDLTNDEHISSEILPWREKLAKVLYAMNPFAFERLAQRVLRECGFTQVEVTKKSGDGGIDGNGKLKINGIFSFNVAFQCKRYQGLVSAGAVRDFRGSLTKNVEKGVLITTGRFTEDAKREASHLGKEQIDLIDGEELITKIAEFRIGVKEVVTYEVDEDFFNKI